MSLREKFEMAEKEIETLVKSRVFAQTTEIDEADEEEASENQSEASESQSQN